MKANNGNPIKIIDAKNQVTLMSYKYGHQLMSRVTDTTGRGFPLVPLASASRTTSGSQTINDPPAGFSWLYRGGICVANGSGQCIGGDSTKLAGVGPAIGYAKDSATAGTVPIYNSTCYSDTAGTCVGWGLSMDVNGPPVGYLSTTAPDAQSANAPFIQSNGLLLQGLTGAASAYLWSITSSTVNVTLVDHFYSNDMSNPAEYTEGDVLGFLRQDPGTGAIALKRYVEASTGRHYYSTSADQSAFTEQATIGYLDTSSSTGLVGLYRHYNETSGDYLLSTSSTPPSGYVLQTTQPLGYLQVPGSTPNNPAVVYVRNPIGQVIQAKTTDVTYTYTHDAAHRVTSVTDSRGNKQLTYDYTPAGLLTVMQDSDGNRTDYDYDPTGRLTGIWAPNNDYTAFVYDDGGRLTEKWFPNGVNTQYTYNRDNTLQQLINRHGAGTIISQHDYTYDGLGNRASHNELINGTLNPYTYAYDELNRLITVTKTGTGAVDSYAYDPLGNRRTKTSGGSTLAYVHDAGNQLLEIHSGSTAGPLTAGLVYDNNGNLAKKCEGGTVTVSPTDCTGTTITSLTHDNFDRLTQVDKTGIPTELYKYDDGGRRIQKTVGATPTNFLYDGPNIISQYDSNWASLATYTHGPGMDAPIMRVAGSTAQFYHQDGLGSIVSVTNQAGATDGTARYDAYGIKLTSTGTVAQYGYTGREPDDTGLIYYRARFYDPTIGRFTRRDPIGMNGGMNLYAYVGNNPIRLNDPMGTSPSEPDPLQFAAASPNYTGTANDAGSMTAGQQSLQRFTEPITGPNGVTYQPGDLTNATNLLYSEMTPSVWTGKLLPRDTESGGQAGVMITATGQAAEADLMASALFNRTSNPTAYMATGNTLSDIIYAPGQFAGVGSRDWNAAVSGNTAAIDLQRYNLAFQAVMATASAGPAWAMVDSWRAVDQSYTDKTTGQYVPYYLPLGPGNINVGSGNDFGTVSSFDALQGRLREGDFFRRVGKF